MSTLGYGLPRWLSGKESACQCRRCKRWVWSLGQEDPLEEGMATQSSILAWRIPWTEEPGRLQSIGLQRVKHYCKQLNIHTCNILFSLRLLLMKEKGNGNLHLQNFKTRLFKRYSWYLQYCLRWISLFLSDPISYHPHNTKRHLYMVSERREEKGRS